MARILAGLGQLAGLLPGACAQHHAAGLSALVAQADFAVAGTGLGAQRQYLRLECLTIRQFIAMLQQQLEGAKGGGLLNEQCSSSPTLQRQQQGRSVLVLIPRVVQRHVPPALY